MSAASGADAPGTWQEDSEGLATTATARPARADCRSCQGASARSLDGADDDSSPDSAPPTAVAGVSTACPGYPTGLSVPTGQLTLCAPRSALSSSSTRVLLPTESLFPTWSAWKWIPPCTRTSVWISLRATDLARPFVGIRAFRAPRRQCWSDRALCPIHPGAPARDPRRTVDGITSRRSSPTAASTQDGTWICSPACTRDFCHPRPLYNSSHPSSARTTSAYSYPVRWCSTRGAAYQDTEERQVGGFSLSWVSQPSWLHRVAFCLGVLLQAAEDGRRYARRVCRDHARRASQDLLGELPRGGSSERRPTLYLGHQDGCASKEVRPPPLCYTVPDGLAWPDARQADSERVCRGVWVVPHAVQGHRSPPGTHRHVRQRFTRQRLCRDFDEGPRHDRGSLSVGRGISLRSTTHAECCAHCHRPQLTVLRYARGDIRRME